MPEIAASLMPELILAFCKANPAKGRELLTVAYERETDPDRKAEIDLLREYACNAAFRSALEEHLYQEHAAH